jgi:hypothetical protein
MLRSTVAAIQATADELAEVRRRLGTVDPGATAFGAVGLGLLGEAGRQAYRHWRAALDARAREADAHAGRLRELADVMSRTDGGFAEASDTVARAQRESEAGLS